MKWHARNKGILFYALPDQRIATFNSCPTTTPFLSLPKIFLDSSNSKPTPKEAKEVSLKPYHFVSLHSI